jgi:hypothetical protein
VHIHVHRYRRRVRDQAPDIDDAEVRRAAAFASYHDALAARHAACGSRQTELHLDIAAHHRDGYAAARAACGYFAAGQDDRGRAAMWETMQQAIGALTKAREIDDEA